jgi:hypothetical protein
VQNRGGEPAAMLTCASQSENFDSLASLGLKPTGETTMAGTCA